MLQSMVSHSRVTARRLAKPAALAALVLAAGMLPACNRALFRTQDERSQYDRYDASRGQYEPMYLEDEFGRRKPNLRGRLAPKN